MKAAVLHQFGEMPRYEDFPDPVAGDGEILVHVKAVALENVDRMMAQGTHYANDQLFPQLPAVMGFDGIGALEDGQMVGFGGIRPPFGAMAPITVIKDKYYVPVPDGIDPVIAAAAPASILTGLLPMKYAGKLQPGETVLINGATGFTGRLAVQVAKLLGAGRVVGTGRNPASLAALSGLGADATIDLSLPDDTVVDAFAEAKGEGYDVILDLLWSHPTELLLKALTPKELSFATRRTRLIHVGEMAGQTIVLPGSALRTSGLEIIGSGNIPAESIPEGSALAWDWLRDGKLHCEIERVPLAEVGAAWARPDVAGKRLVIVP